jgi:D-3-phosphoglycerate dehydrogenase
MSAFRVLVTDRAWPDFSIEQSVLSAVDAQIVAPAATDAATLAREAVDVDAIMTNWARVTGEVIAAAGKCRIVSRMGIGLDNIDVAAATARGMLVTNVPDYCLEEVAEHALALLLALGRKIGFYHLQTKSGVYDLSAGPALERLSGQTLGIVGLGAIGSRLAARAHAIGLRVLATSRTARPAPPGIEWRPLDELLSQSDYVSLHVPATPETRRLIGRDALSLMKPTAYLINTSRGALIDNDALAEALAAGRIAGAGLDVQDPEPPNLSKAPWNDPRVIVTPHAAFVSRQSLANLRARAARQVAACLTGETPENVVNARALAARTT